MELLDKQLLEAKNVLKILVKKYKIDKKIFDDFEKNKTIYITEDTKLYEIYSIYLVEEGKADIYKKNINVFIKYDDILQKTNKTLQKIKKEKKDLFL